MKPPSLSRGLFGWHACKLADNYSARELADAIQWVANDPSCANPAHARGDSIYLLNPKAIKISKQLAWAVYHQKQDKQRSLDSPRDKRAFERSIAP